MKSDNATKTMLIRRHVLLLTLSSMSLAAPRLAAQQVQPTTDEVALQAFALDSLVAQGTDYYTPTPVTSPLLLELLAVAPSLSQQLLQYYQAGGTNPYQSTLPFISPALRKKKTKSLLDFSPVSGTGLELSAPELSFLPPTSGPTLERLPIDLSGLNSYSYGLRQRMLAHILPLRGGIGGREFSSKPKTLVLTRPSFESAERALSEYTKETPTLGLQLPQDRNLSVLQQRHWIPALESSIQFSQNHVSDNWYKGGASNLNLFMRTYFGLRYVTERVQWTNEIESKLNVYNAEKDRNKMYYTIDAELRTQLLHSYLENMRSLQSDFLAPYTINVGLGMKYDYSMKSTRVYGRSFDLSINVAPLSYTFRATKDSHIDLGRHGLSPDKLWYQRIGSTIRANWQWRVNMNLTWTSRFYFNTSYQQVEAEWENTLDMALTRFFSTRLNLNLRYDDAVRPAPGWNKHLQYNELLSFGFNYRL